MRHLFLALLSTILFAGLAGAAPTVFLKDGSHDSGSSVWMENDKVYVSTPAEIHEYDRDEVRLDETMRYNQIGTYQAATIPGDHALAPPPRKAHRPRRAVAAAHGTAQEKPTATATATPAKQPTEPAVTPATSTAAKPQPAPQSSSPAPPAPMAKETSPPEAAEPSLMPDKAELEKRKQEAVAMMAEAVTKKDPELMKKALEMQKDIITLQKAAQQAGGAPKAAPAGLSLTLALLILAACLLVLVANWIIFEKAGQAGWKCLVPIYNMYILMVVAGKPWWWFLLLFVPLVGAVIYLLAMLSLAKRFGRSELFGVGVFLLPMIFLPVLAFSDSPYQG